jgi:uracil-DNA glycosylase
MLKPDDTMGAVQALDAFLANPANARWAAMAPFQDGSVAFVCAAVDRDIAAGYEIAPTPQRMFAALELTPPENARVILLGQDPYPTPGHANGLAFSYAGGGQLPRSLVNIFRELGDDLGLKPPRDGDLTRWAKQGVLLLNAALTVRAGTGEAGSHLGLGWQKITDALLVRLLTEDVRRVLILWGSAAQKKALFVDPAKHFVIASAHPSPLSAARGFFGSKPFSRCNAWLEDQGLAPIDWR